MLYEGEGAMKIGYDGRFLTKEISGNGVFTSCLLDNLAKLDEDSRYFVYVNYETSFQARENVSLRKMSSFHRNPYLRYLFTFPFELSRHPVDIFHAFYSVPRRVPAKVVLSLVEFFWSTNPERIPLSGFFKSQLSLMTRHAVKRADVIIVPTRFVREKLFDHFNLSEDKVVVIPLGLNEYFTEEPTPREILEAKNKYPLDRKYILAVGDLHNRKNLEALVDVYALLKKKKKIDHRLIIAGKDKVMVAGRPVNRSQSLLTKIADSAFSEDILVTGYIPISHLRVLYREADLYVLPSLDEGFGLTTHEAMACRTPLACSDRGSLPDVVGDAAVFFNPTDLDEMYETILRALQDTDLLPILIILNHLGDIRS